MAGAHVGSEISYQGLLDDAGGPITGQVDMIFTLYDAPTLGAVVGAPFVSDGQAGNGLQIDVTDGLFTACPDFGANVFDGTALWLEIMVRSPHDPTDTALYTTLDPRQPIKAAPIALQTRGIFVDETTGDVGIGINQPERRMHVRGSLGALRIDRDAQSAGIMMVRYPPGDFNTVGKVFTIGVDGFHSDGSGKFWIVDHETNVSGLGLPRLTIDNVGNVGIGTTSPNAKLEVAGTAGADGIMFPDGTLQTTAATGGAAGNTLDAAYDQGGAGLGRTITADAGAVEILGPDGLTVAGTITSGSSIIIDGTAGAETITSTDALELHTSSGRILRLEPEVDASGAQGNSPNIIAGWSGNTVTAGVAGATIAGGGVDDDGLGNPGPNQVTDDFGTVSGGYSNTASGLHSTIGGGHEHTASGHNSTVGGGASRTPLADKTQPSVAAARTPPAVPTRPSVAASLTPPAHWIPRCLVATITLPVAGLVSPPVAAQA